MASENSVSSGYCRSLSCKSSADAANAAKSYECGAQTHAPDWQYSPLNAQSSQSSPHDSSLCAAQTSSFGHRRILFGHRHAPSMQIPLFNVQSLQSSPHDSSLCAAQTPSFGHRRILFGHRRILFGHRHAPSTQISLFNVQSLQSSPHDASVSWMQNAPDGHCAISDAQNLMPSCRCSDVMHRRKKPTMMQRV